MSSRPPISRYDRSRLLDDDAEPPKLESLRDATFEHQAAAIRLGYNSVLEMCVDMMIQELADLKRRVETLENQ